MMKIIKLNILISQAIARFVFTWWIVSAAICFVVVPKASTSAKISVGLYDYQMGGTDVLEYLGVPKELYPSVEKALCPEGYTCTLTKGRNGWVWNDLMSETFENNLRVMGEIK